MDVNHDLAARLAKAERALEEAEKVIKPFADAAARVDRGGPDNAGFIGAALLLSHLRAARKWMESLPSPPKEG